MKQTNKKRYSSLQKKIVQEKEREVVPLTSEVEGQPLKQLSTSINVTETRPWF